MKIIAKPTFAATRLRLLATLAKNSDWTVNVHQKTPKAYRISGKERVTLYFKAQALYGTTSVHYTSLSDARSWISDIRDINPDEFLRLIDIWSR